MAITLTQVALDSILGGANQNVVAGNYTGILYGAKALLFTNTPVITSQSVYADFTQPTWTGYAEATVTWTGPVIDPVGNLLVQTGIISFVPSAAPSPAVLVYGHALENTTVPSAGHNLIGAELFPNPISVSSTLTAVLYVVQIILPQQPIYGGAVLL